MGALHARGSKGGQGTVTDEVGREYIRKVLPPPPPPPAMGRWPGCDITRWHGAAHTAALPAQPSTAPRPRVALLVPAELSLGEETHSPPAPSPCLAPYLLESPRHFPIPAPAHQLLPDAIKHGD